MEKVLKRDGVIVDFNSSKITDAIKKASDEYEALKHLQFEFMENHEKISDGIYRSTYSDGTTITVDYNKETYSVE